MSQEPGSFFVSFNEENLSLTVTGTAEFHRGEWALSWLKANNTKPDWVFYNIAFGAPEAQRGIPEVFPITGIAITDSSITATNSNTGNPQRLLAVLPYTLYIRFRGKILPFTKAEPSSNFAEEPLQLENEPNGT